MQLVMVARETHLCSWIRLCSPCFILSHIMNILKWFSTELSYGECTAYRGSKCLDVSCVCVFFYFGTQWNSSRYLSIVLENSRVPSSVWVLPSQIWGWVRRGSFTRHSAKLLPIFQFQQGLNFLTAMRCWIPSWLQIFSWSCVLPFRGLKADKPVIHMNWQHHLWPWTVPSFQKLNLDWPGWNPDSNVCIKQWHLCITIQ